jgi:poly-gamma-glutamate synthesis protein (capsule biosynthesis protein)
VLVAVTTTWFVGAALGRDDSVAATPPATDVLPGQAAARPGQPGEPGEQAKSDGKAEDDGATATLAFAGDVHFAGSSARAVDGGLGGIADLFRQADLSVVNLETAITERGTPAPKQYTFRAPARALTMLLDSGVDAVTLANNHGMDFGQQGLADTLDAADAAGLPVLGAGTDADRAHAPLRREVNGIKVSVLAATDVLDGFATTSWVATGGQPGMASAKDPQRLLEAVRAEKERSDVVAVYLHWGKELQTCPTPRQRELAGLVAGAGADLIVGSHAHLLQPADVVDGASVHYGLGNFVFYARKEITTRTGVLTVQVGRSGVQDSTWHPATIVNGVPVLDSDPSRHPLPPIGACPTT